MNRTGAARTHLIAEQFGKALRLVRGALSSAGLEVVGELEVAGAKKTGKKERCKVLLVDCPLLSLEALALDRAAAVYLPLHVMLSGEDGRTHVSIVNPADVLDGRLPAGAADPIGRLQAQVTRVLDGLQEAK